MHKITNYEEFITADSGQLIDSDLEEFQTIFSEHYFDEVTTVNSFSSVTFDFGVYVLAVNGFANTSSFNGLSWIPGSSTFIINSLYADSEFSDLRIGKVNGIWFSGNYTETIWTKQ
jgi:hypothetical protein